MSAEEVDELAFLDLLIYIDGVEHRLQLRERAMKDGVWIN